MGAVLGHPPPRALELLGHVAAQCHGVPASLPAFVLAGFGHMTGKLRRQLPPFAQRRLPAPTAWVLLASHPTQHSADAVFHHPTV